MTVLKYELRVARKSHPCGGWYWFDRSCYGERDVEPSDWQIVEAARAAGGRITPGMQYLHQVSVDGDGFAVFKARPDMHDVCLKYDLYPED